MVGKRGERSATEYLRSRGFFIRGTNVRFGRYEIDIVAYDPSERMIVFVEVKTRSAPDERYSLRGALDGRKRRALRRAIYRWCAQHRYEGPGRIDLLCVSPSGVFEHLVNLGADFY